MNKENHISMKNGINGMDLDQLTQRLKREDTRNLRISNNFRYLFLVMIILYSLLFIVNPDHDLCWPDRISGMCFVLAFVVFAWLFQKYYQEYRSIDYSRPVAEMLQMAAKRYSLRNRKSLIMIIPLLLIDIGITISFSQHREMFTPGKWIWVVQVVYIPVLAISFLIGVWIWYRRQKPIRDRTLKLLDELNN